MKTYNVKVELQLCVQDTVPALVPTYHYSPITVLRDASCPSSTLKTFLTHSVEPKISHKVSSSTLNCKGSNLNILTTLYWREGN
ncbi:hypothetical protein ACB092_05G037200 [Castanea dentata]